MGPRRSRYGCRNCKLRKTKCDEKTPQCGNCRKFGVVCNFDFKVPDLLPLVQNRTKQREGHSKTLLLELPLSSGMWVSCGSDTFSLDLHDQELFHRFRYRTLSSLWGLSAGHVCADRTFGDCLNYGFLMHAVLAVSALHDRYLGVQTVHYQPVRQAYHLSRSIALFRDSLTNTIGEAQKDAVWATAVFLAILTMSSTVVSSPSECWPLTSSDSSTVEWLRLKASDKALWTIADPLRADSAFSTMSDTLSQMKQELPAKGISGMPARLAQACHLNEKSTEETNPYFLFAHGLSRLIGEPQGEASLGVAFIPINSMSPTFRTLLEDKDPVALLLLCLWYTRARHCKWWIEFRARHAVPSICAYLQHNHADLDAVEMLVLVS
ncbi:hypothetical protein EJ05DRAFT_337075 [Pseudovirgaria hyperparasitica]|uniref:Zn(2)-C6 fungal-type domain-containing protein n=1 Tax=Pseudovirgaria hyperparasitica TaxID=470096 RepID=A0A6A6W962_9PEZI|nr:uncharacterized protein EJ05DRAFT_337075 [Pseudovirgaria hyperparasitica]KAF2759203.1 hypothetical protein EJ05DRAFT_337075 [Pseudovirgaria hyperparasitica]